MYVVSVDLSGPAGPQNTGVALLKASGPHVAFVAAMCDGSDAALLDLVQRAAEQMPVVVGLDAPLSYEPGGGQRARDIKLRKEIVARGMKPGSVMAPTAPRMVYLTLRGIALANVLARLPTRHPVRVVEIHPGAALAFRAAPLDAILNFAAREDARADLLSWMMGHASGIEVEASCTSHFVAACAGALAAWDWAMDRPHWLAVAEPPWHPFDFAA